MRKPLRIAYVAAWGAWFATITALAIASIAVGEWIAVPAFSPESNIEGTILFGLFLGFIYLTPGLLLVSRNYFARKLRA